VRYYDATNPEARQYIWEKVTDGYAAMASGRFWLDCLRTGDAALRTLKTPCTTSAQAWQCRTFIPADHARGFAEGSGQATKERRAAALPLGVGRQSRYRPPQCAQATTDYVRRYLRYGGLNIAISGSRVDDRHHGGFKRGDPSSPYFESWWCAGSKFGVFCPLFRLHGVREPAPLVGSELMGAPMRSDPSAMRRTA